MKTLRKLKIRLFIVIVLGLPGQMILAQNAPSMTSDNGLFAAAPGSGGTADIGSVSLATGTVSTSVPIFDVKCGSLTLPITLGYSYNGFDPEQDASWTGLGWNLIAGGMVTRNIQGALDSTRVFGKNYGQYNIVDSILNGNNGKFLTNAFTNNADTSYDMAPDIFSASFNGYSGNFYWYNGRQYMLSYTKQFKVSWPNVTGSMTLTSSDGTSYYFGQPEVVTSNIPGSGVRPYTAAWYLTSVISADKKDTIFLNYSLYSWNQLPSPYNNWYVQGNNLTIPYNDSVSNTMTVPLLQSITCRTTQVNFKVSSQPRTDLLGNSPFLQEIDIIDLIASDTLKKALFTYGYFGQTSTNPAYTERLKLKQVSFVNPMNSNDLQNYKFSYLNEFNAGFPDKRYPAVDHWEFYNATASQYFTGTTDGLYRTPNLYYGSYAALDTVVYPMGGYTTFQYEQNDYDSSTTQPFKPGPGIRLKTISQFSAGMTIPAMTKTYSYLNDNGASSGVLSWAAQTAGPITISDAVDFNEYVMSNNNPGSPILSNNFYYGKVSELSTSGNEKHRSDYYFQSFSNVFNDLELVQKLDYRYDSVLAKYSPLTDMMSVYNTTADSSFLVINTFTNSAITTGGNLSYNYGYTYYYNNTYWKRLVSQQMTQYDNTGDSTTIINQYNYNIVRNMDSVRQTLPDGRAKILKYKYPEDYSTAITGNMVAANITAPVIESQTWLQNAGVAPNMISGSIIGYDQTIFKPTSIYSLEPSAPLASLNNETIVSGKYTSLVSDNSNYVLKGQVYYDGNNNVSQENKTSDINTSFIWDYRHSMPTAQVSNAAANQIAFTSFEADNSGNWKVPDSFRIHTSAITGSTSFNLVSGYSIIDSPAVGTPYIVSYWSTNGPVTVSANGVSVAAGPAGLVKNGWTYYEHLLPNTTSAVSLTASNTLIDELRLYPSTAQMSTGTYLPQIGVSSKCDVSNHVTYYTYDGFGRLKYIKDQDGNIIKTIDYHLIGQ